MTEASHEVSTNHPANATPGLQELDVPSAIRRAFPFLQLTRSLGYSFDLNKIALSVLGLILLQLAWSVLDASLLDSDGVKQLHKSPYAIRWEASETMNPISGFSGPFERLSLPHRILFSPFMAFVTVHPFDRIGIHAILSLLTTIIIWGVIGGAIARIALVQVGWGRGLGLKGALEYTATHVRPLIMTPLLPLLVILITAVFCGMFGTIFRLPWIGNFLGQALLVIPISLGLLMFVMAAGLIAGWPLMVVSVAAEGEDELDAVSRSFSYVNHRLVPYLFYLAIVLLIGIPGYWLVDLIANGTLAMVQWGLGLTVPHQSVVEMFGIGSPSIPPAGLVESGLNGERIAGAGIANVWIRFVELAAQSWAFSYFWTSLSMIYLIIRKDVDGAAWSQLKPETLHEAPQVETSHAQPAQSGRLMKPTETPASIPLMENA